MPPDKPESDPKPDPSGSGKTLSEQLAEYEAAMQAKSKGGDDSPEYDFLKKDFEELRKQITPFIEARAEEIATKDLREVVVPIVKGDLDVSDKVVENWVLGNDAKDLISDELQEMWQSGKTKTSEFKEGVKALVEPFADYAKENGLIGTEKSTKKRGSSLSAAVRSSRADEPDSGKTRFDGIDWNSLSDSDFAMKSSEVMRAFRAGELTQ